jgi:hypothetical protein
MLKRCAKTLPLMGFVLFTGESLNFFHQQVKTKITAVADSSRSTASLGGRGFEELKIYTDF